LTSNSSPAPDGRTDVAELAVGWIGFGDQGLPMATAIVEQGFSLHAWARRPTSLDGLGDLEHVRHDDVAGLAAASDVVGLCVGTDDDVWSLITGGLLDGLRPGSTVVNQGTGTPANARKFAEACASSGVEVLDAPVSGGRPAAVQRRLITMVGGPDTAAARCLPIFQTFSRDVVHLGGAGAGQTAKLFNNALMIMNQAAIADVFELASKSDVNPVRLFEVLKEASAGSTVLGLFNTMITTDTVDHLAKVQGLDLDLFDTAMRESGLDGSAVTARGRSGNDRLSAVVRVLNP
jgi:3-hydroxyisobutyrate dehydrogenase-like beta-hydroxyacid dehydrogenase